MRRSKTLRGLLVLASTLAIGFALAPTDLSFSLVQALAQDETKIGNTPPNKTTTTTTPDSKYGAGGQVITVSDDKYNTVISELHVDSNGVVREEHQHFDNGSIRVIFQDPNGQWLGFYEILPTGENDPNREWFYQTYKPGDRGGIPTGKYVKDRGEGMSLGTAASDHFAKTGDFRPPQDNGIKTNVPQPNLPSQEEPKTAQEQPSIQSKEVFSRPTREQKPQQQALPKAATTNTQSSAPKTCGEITDRETLLALGCVSAPGTRPTVAAPSQPAVTPASSRTETDCFSDPACFAELKAREEAYGREQKSDPRREAPDRPPVGYPGYPMPGGSPGYAVPGGSPGYPVR
jgi:hypothetical protein